MQEPVHLLVIQPVKMRLFVLTSQGVPLQAAVVLVLQQREQLMQDRLEVEA